MQQPKRNILQKLILILFYVESVAYLDRYVMLGLSTVLFAVSFYVDGAKPYWPVFMLIFILEYLELSNLQTLTLIVTAFFINSVKLYQIPIPGKGQLNSGYNHGKFDNLQFCIFYPTQQSGKKTNWFTNKGYFKTLYEIFYVDPETKRMPLFIFAFFVSFLTKITMPVFSNTKLYVSQQNEKKKFKIIIFSHGLGANMNGYSSICGWFASHGYIVVSVQHDHDQICVDYTHLPRDDIWKIRDFLWEVRNRDLTIRVAQVRKVVRAIIQNKFFPQYLNEQISASQIHLAGHSYGGCTVLQTLAQLIKQKNDHHIKSIIALDPWMFPLDHDSYEVIKNKNILIINSQTFWAAPTIPSIYELQKKFLRLKQSNSETLKALVVTKMNHLDQSDMTFVFGNILQMFRKNAHYYLGHEILQLNLVLTSVFLEGKDISDIIRVGNEFCRQNELDAVGFEVMEEFRNDRRIMLDFQKERQAIVDKLNTKGKFIKRIFWQ